MVFESPLAPTPIPELDLFGYVFERAEAFRDKPAFIDGPTGRAYTYGQLLSDTDRLGRGLADRGFGKGDVCAIFSPNVPEFALAFHGVLRIGGIVTTVNPTYTAEELERQLTDASAKILVTVPALMDKAQEAAKRSGVETLYVVGEAEGATPLAALLDNGGDAPRPAMAPEDIAALPYSSGTTGLQKGVMLTHGNLVANLAQTEAAFAGMMTDRDVTIGVLPFFHIYGLAVIMNYTLRQGATAVTMPRFDLEGYLKLSAEHRVTIGYLVPPIVLALTKTPLVDEYDLSSLRWILSAAAPLGADVGLACSERLGCQVFQGYGLTETSPVSHLSPFGEGEAKAGSVGRCIPNTESKIVDPETGREMGVGESGEIWIRGPQVMKGYLGNPEATAACIDDDGFFHSGDLGYVDEDGHFFIVDRLKELIKYKGFQVAPAELEALLLTHPSIADAAVIPKPDEEAGEVPKAFLVARDEVDAEAVKAFVAERVAPYKKLRDVEFVDAIPKSPSGKILRRVLVERERAR